MCVGARAHTHAHARTHARAHQSCRPEPRVCAACCVQACFVVLALFGLLWGGVQVAYTRTHLEQMVHTRVVQAPPEVAGAHSCRHAACVNATCTGVLTRMLTLTDAGTRTRASELDGTAVGGACVVFPDSGTCVTYCAAWHAECYHAMVRVVSTKCMRCSISAYMS